MANLKVLLLFPNTSNEGVFPLAIGILSTIAKKLGATVKYFETTFYKKGPSTGEDHERSGEFKPVDREKTFKFLPCECIQKDFDNMLVSYKPDILAVSANTPEYELFCELIENSRNQQIKPFVIVGGCHATVAPEKAIRNPYVDAICIGEGEEAWEEFLLKFKQDEDITNIKNLWVKTPSGIKKNSLRPLISQEKLWATPLDYSLFDKRHFTKPFDGKMSQRARIELSRGCPYSCNYCANSAFKNTYKNLGKFFRIRPLDNLREATKKLMEFGCNVMQLSDECFFNIDYKTLEEFCKWYGTEIKLPLLLQTRPESVTESKVKLLANTGITVQISCGVESGNERILKEICNRHVNLDQIRNAFKIIKKFGLASKALTMIGLPTETRGEAFDTILLLRQIRPDISIMSIFFPFEGTPLRKYCLEKGYISGNEESRTLTDTSILRNQPMSPDEITNLRRTYILYTRLPEKYFPQIELCEKDYEEHKELFDELVSLSWKFMEKHRSNLEIRQVKSLTSTKIHKNLPCDAHQK